MRYTNISKMPPLVGMVPSASEVQAYGNESTKDKGKIFILTITGSSTRFSNSSQSVAGAGIIKLTGFVTLLWVLKSCSILLTS